MHTRTPCQQANAIHHAAANPAAQATAQDASTLPEHERQRCEVWTRVMGYHRPTSEFNPGKQSEHRERSHFIEPASPSQAHD
ncbi:MAG: anaerobic ribonucleoside-triphosphate reductase [Brachymonas sp.]|nr:anaerobic ribonucleoside-triphosphate reductase [Brachymonas sp.]